MSVLALTRPISVDSVLRISSVESVHRISSVYDNMYSIPWGCFGCSLPCYVMPTMFHFSLCVSCQTFSLVPHRYL